MGVDNVEAALKSRRIGHLPAIAAIVAIEREQHRPPGVGQRDKGGESGDADPVFPVLAKGQIVAEWADALITDRRSRICPPLMNRLRVTSVDSRSVPVGGATGLAPA